MDKFNPYPESPEKFPKHISQAQTPHERLFIEAYLESITDEYPKTESMIKQELMNLLQEQGDAVYAQELQNFSKKYHVLAYSAAGNILIRENLDAYPQTKLEVLRTPKI